MKIAQRFIAGKAAEFLLRKGFPMSHSFTSVLCHCTFSTKERRPQITEDLQPRLWPFMGGIESQANHHRRLTFQDEFRAFLKKHGMEYDERYIWD